MQAFVNRNSELKLINKAFDASLDQRRMLRSPLDASLDQRRMLRSPLIGIFGIVQGIPEGGFSHDQQYLLICDNVEALVQKICERVYLLKLLDSTSYEQRIRKVVSRWYRKCSNPSKKIFFTNSVISFKKKSRRRSRIHTAPTTHKLSPDSSYLLDTVVICPITKHIIEEEEFYGRDRNKPERTCRS